MLKTLITGVFLAGVAAFIGLADAGDPISTPEAKPLDKVLCDPKIDPSCDDFQDPIGPIEPIADPISTPEAKPLDKVLCDPKTDPTCDN
ncbi:hypothetical protein [Gimesia maris]|uniref:hypothetical protein n=1 Tax=Gimesia maris TaxID=122 RepID=UPI0030DA8189|tara:strand:- start:133501 stop:133767 length:267 start_codon:yes stop_codon:yes gene_type:complete